MKWIGYITNPLYDFSDKKQDYGIPPAYIVKKFSLSSFNRVKLRVSALGVYTLYVNGKMIHDDFMSQDLSEYDRTIYYRDYDISQFVQKGLNSLGIVLCDGWYTSRLSIVGRNVFGEYPDKIAFQIFIDGKVQIESDGSEVANEGAIRACDNQNGIIIDHNYNLGDFSNPIYDVSKWHQVETYEVQSKLKKSLIKPVKLEKAFAPKLLYQFGKHHIYDVGQNITGVVSLKVQGSKNKNIEVLLGEILKENHEVYRENLRSSLAKCLFTLSGKDEEEFLPRTTFFGFRFIDLVYGNDVEIKELKAIAFHTKMSRTGYIKTNNRLVNKLYNNILWGQRDNFLSIPTDCPQRDERMGWTGDAQIFSETASFNYDSHAFLKKYVLDMCDAMDLNKGRLPCFVPFFHKNSDVLTDDPYNWCHDAQGWSDAIIIIPLNLYLYYGDKQILKKTLPYMKKYIKYTSKTRLIDGFYKGHSFGDWLSVFEETDKELYDNAYYARDNFLVSKVCEILGDESKEKYLSNFNHKKELFRERFLTKEGRLTSDTQGAYLLSYAFGLISKEECHQNIVRKINQFKHLTTGFHSTKYLLPVLCEFNEGVLAYQLLNRRKYPSWGYMISCGSTTIWERWDSFRKETGPNKDGMNSFNHYSLGSVGEWMYKDMVGLKPTLENPGFKTTIVEPSFNNSVSHVKSSLKTVRGKIKVEYEIKNQKVFYQIEGDERIRFDFRFKNKVLKKEKTGNNSFKYELEMR